MKELFVDISSGLFDIFFWEVRSFCEGFVRRDLLGTCLIQFSLNLFSECRFVLEIVLVEIFLTVLKRVF